MRNWWYEVVAEKWPTGADRTEDIGRAQVIDDLRAQINQLATRLDEKPTPAALGEIRTDLISATRLGEGVHANVRCHNCGTAIGLMIGGNACPNCGAPLS